VTVKQRNVAILIFDDVEVLDFCGPFEVFSIAGEPEAPDPFNVYTVAEATDPIQAINGLSVNPKYTIADCPPPDILLVPGGYGTRKVMKNEALVNWVKEQAKRVELLLSVCTGSLVLGAAGLLDGLEATTHHQTFDLLAEIAPKATLCPDKRYVDNGKIVLSAGISAGIDMSFHVVRRLVGEDLALEAARYMEYDWHPDKPTNT
jgi:transcriptional regulator GlxA family with amidase domain